MSLLQNSNAISDSSYNIANSLRFQSASSQYLSRTPASVTNQTTMTFSWWIKVGVLNTTERLFSSNAAAYDFTIYMSGDTLTVYNNLASVTNTTLTTTQVFRDPSAWYHIVVAIDTTQATNTNRVKIYVNGSQVTAFSTATYPAQNTLMYWDNTNPHTIGRNNTSPSQYFDGYMTEVNFVDGQALTPSSFGETNTLTGQWVAKKYNGTYGTNGFYLPFSNGTSTTTLGSDSSGNGNNWTLNNFTRSAGVSDCWMIDVPSGNGGASSTQPNSNYSVLNPLLFNTGLTTYSAANLSASLGNASNWRSALSTIFVRSGLWYAEMVVSSNANNFFGVALSNSTFWNAGAVSIVGWTTDSWSYSSTGNKYTNATATALGSAMSAGDIIGIALDLDNGAIYFSANGVFLGGAVPTSGAAKTNAAYSLTTGLEYMFAISGVGGTTASVNFGQRSFAYTPPSGFKALCTANLPASTIVKGNQYMDATLWTGNGAARSITNAASFQPDLVWVKNRSSGTFWNVLFDSNRGAGNQLTSNGTDAELASASNVAGKVSAFNSNGFSVTAGSGSIFSVNGSSDSYVGWQWQAGQGTTSSNTSGTITSTVSVNATAGFSIVTYTGTGANATVGHGLGVAPRMIIVKQRSGVNDWPVYHIGQNATPQNGLVYLNATNAYAAASNVWNNTAPTSSVFSVGTNGAVNSNTATYVAYCFSEIAGFSKFGSYTGNGSTDGPFIFTGFRPKFVMIKRTDSANNWVMLDSSRDTFNVTEKNIYADTSGAEAVYAAEKLDFLSNGFKQRQTGVSMNANGGTYIYMAFAENPLAQSNAR